MTKVLLIDDDERHWLARLVATRRIVILPTANAVGYYRNQREELSIELSIDVNRDFPFDITNSRNCMQTIAARALNEVVREHMFQMALVFHGGIELLGYEWGAPTFQGSRSPDDESQNQIAAAYSRYGGRWSGTSLYPYGRMQFLEFVISKGKSRLTSILNSSILNSSR